MAREHLQRLIRRGLHLCEYVEGLLTGLYDGRFLALRNACMLLCAVLTGFYEVVTMEVGVVMREKAVGWEVPQDLGATLNLML